MPNPAKSSCNVQATAFQSVLIVSQRMTVGTIRLLQKQQQVLANGPQNRRAQDRGVKTACLSRGPDLRDHYGRRGHDVDVERL